MLPLFSDGAFFAIGYRVFYSSLRPIMEPIVCSPVGDAGALKP